MNGNISGATGVTVPAEMTYLLIHLTYAKVVTWGYAKLPLSIIPPLFQQYFEAPTQWHRGDWWGMKFPPKHEMVIITTVWPLCHGLPKKVFTCNSQYESKKRGSK